MRWRYHGFVVGQREVNAVDAEFFGSAGDGALNDEIGLVLSAVATSQSCQLSPAGAPSTFATASLAANRTAWERTFRVRSLGVKTRRTKAGVSVTIRSNRSMLTVSTPIPMIMSFTFYGRGGNRVLFAVSLVLSLARFVSFRWDSVKYDAWLMPVSQRHLCWLIHE